MTEFKPGQFYNIRWKKKNLFPVPAKCIKYKNDIFLYNVHEARLIKTSDINYNEITVM